MEAHHKAWLSKHHQPPEFLQQAIEAGFHVHHIDGDHDNNDTANLVLIFGRDHMSLHSMAPAMGDAKRNAEKAAHTRSRKKAKRGCQAYGLRLTGVTWAEIARSTGIKSPLNAAKHYASVESKPWPPI